MEDVGRVPAEVASTPVLEPATVPTVDGWIESLMACKQLAESDVQRLCEKVCPLSTVASDELWRSGAVSGEQSPPPSSQSRASPGRASRY